MNLHPYTRAAHALGCEICMTVVHGNAEVAAAALDAAFAEVSHVERVMSIYSGTSDLARLNAAGALNNPDPYLVQVLKESCEISKRTGGAFDVTVQPLWTLYAAAKQTGSLPSDSDLITARTKIDWRAIMVSRRKVRLLRAGMAITLNGIAQGFAADRVMETLRDRGIEHALVDTGEIASLGHKADGSAWRVGIQHPRQADAYIAIAELDGRAMTTSGDYQTRFTEDFVYNHIFEPGTGKSPTGLSSVTVVAPTATLADGLSTAIFVLGPEKSLELLQSFKDVDVLLVTKDCQAIMTDGFPICRVGVACHDPDL